MGHCFECEDASIGLLCVLVDRLAETFFEPEREAERKENGIEIVVVLLIPVGSKILMIRSFP